jgi:hypothetical protein
VVDRYRRKINGPPKGPQQRKMRAERTPGQIVSDVQRCNIYGNNRYENIEREFIDNTPVSRSTAMIEAGSSLHDL